MKTTRRLTLLSMALWTAAPALAVAQTYPSKPIRLITPFAAGGPSDNAARALSEALAKSLGQPVIVDSRPGADGAIAGQAVATAAPDGHTLLWGTSSVIVGAPLLQKPAPYDGLNGFTPIAVVGRFTYTLAVHPDVPAKTVAELIEYAKRNPDKLNFGTGTLTEYMAAVQFMKATGVKMTRVPYKGGAQVMQDLIAGRVHVHFGPISLHQPQAKDGKLRLLANLQSERSPTAPDLPTLAEAGVRGVDAPTWQAVFAPPKTPREISDVLARELRRATQDPALRAAFERQTVQMETQPGPEGLAITLRQDLAQWEQFIRENGITQP